MENRIRLKYDSLNLLLIRILLFCFFIFVDTTAAVTTAPPTTTPVLNSWYLKYAAALHRKNKKLVAKPVAVMQDVSIIQCLTLCLQSQTGAKSRICLSFNYAARTCYMLKTYVCDGEQELVDAPGYSYFDLSDDFTKEVDYLRSKQCEYKGKCSNKCLKFKLFKTPVSWQEAHDACREEEAFLAMPRNDHDHETLIGLLKKGNTLQSWIGVRKREGIFYYDNGSLLGNYTIWGPDQPNDSGGTQQCVQMMSEMDYMWNDYDCARPVAYICQYVW